MKAMEAANYELNTNLKTVSQLYGINVYRFDQTLNPIKYAVTPDMVFWNWMQEEAFFNEKNELLGKLYQ